MDFNTALIIANVYFAASFLADRSAFWAAFIFGWVWLIISFTAKFA